MKARRIVPRILLLLLICSGAAAPASQPKSIHQRAADSSIYQWVPRYRNEIAWYDFAHWFTWAMFGNERDGIFGEDGNPPYAKKADFRTFMGWTARNPMSNFTFYVIGSEDWEKHSSYSVIRSDNTGTHMFGPDRQPQVFGKGSSAFTFAFNDYKPYLAFKFPLSDRHQSDFYIGWRPEGHFGIKVRPYVKRDKKAATTRPTTQKL